MRRPGVIKGTGTLAATLVAAVAIGLVAAVFASAFTLRGATDAAVHPAAMAMMLTLLAIPLIRWAAGGDKLIERIMFSGLIAKGCGTAARIVFNEGGADASYYNRAGAQIAELFANGFIGPGDPRFATRGTGTNNLSYVVGWIYHFTGAQQITAYVIFSFVSFVGMVLFYRAAATAIPGLDRVRYALLLFFLPSMLFWPSSLGKDAWMVGCLGLATLGASGLLRHRYSVGYVLALVSGIGLAAWIRPHIAALLTLALVAALVWPSRTSGSRLRQIVFASIALLVLTVVLGRVADYFGAERFEVTALLDEAASRTAEGGSEFNPVRVSGPFSFALATVTVLFRPLPFEASSVFQLLNSFEAIALIALAFATLANLTALPRAFLNEAYVRLVVVYTLGFIMAFSVISNFGILARQKVQLWPFILVLLALPGHQTKATRFRRARRLNTPDPDIPEPTMPETDAAAKPQPAETGSDLYVP